MLDDAGNVTASYGYSAYGGSDAPSADPESLSSGDPDPQAPINPYRYASRRMDSGTVPSTTPTVPAGSGGYDMGARRYGPDLGAFLQQDQYYGALSDLGLATDPLTQNRYALAGGNPVSYVEWDGHTVTADNPVSANPTLNVQLNSPDSTWSGKDRFVGCACAGLDQQVQAANQAQQRRGPAGAVGNFLAGLGRGVVGFVENANPWGQADISLNNPVSAMVTHRIPVLRDVAGWVAEHQATKQYDESARILGADTSSAAYSGGDISVAVVGAVATGGVGGAARAGAATTGARALVRSGRFLRGTEGNAGIVPKSVAETLRGRSFSSADDFRETFWRAVADDPALTAQFSRSNVTRMRRGLAPIAPQNQQYGNLRSYILHHRTPVARGGDPYDPDNILVVTPRYNQEVLSPSYHFGSSG